MEASLTLEISALTTNAHLHPFTICIRLPSVRALKAQGQGRPNLTVSVLSVLSVVPGLLQSGHKRWGRRPDHDWFVERALQPQRTAPCRDMSSQVRVLADPACQIRAALRPKPISHEYRSSIEPSPRSQKPLGPDSKSETWFVYWSNVILKSSTEFTNLAILNHFVQSLSEPRDSSFVSFVSFVSFATSFVSFGFVAAEAAVAGAEEAEGAADAAGAAGTGSAGGAGGAGASAAGAYQVTTVPSTPSTRRNERFEGCVERCWKLKLWYDKVLRVLI